MIIQNTTSSLKKGYFAQIEQVPEGFCSFLYYFSKKQIIVERDEFQDTLENAKISFEKIYGFSSDGWYYVGKEHSLL